MADVTVDVLVVTFARREGRRGPGAGRPAKLYARAPGEVVVQLPPRDDALAGHLLAAAIEADATGAAREALRDVARSHGELVGRALGEGGDLLQALTERGYEPAEDEWGIRLRNCPFHHLVGEHLELVCGLNEDLLGAALAASGAPMTARLDPRPGHCCVLLEPTGAAPTP